MVGSVFGILGLVTARGENIHFPTKFKLVTRPSFFVSARSEGHWQGRVFWIKQKESLEFGIAKGLRVGINGLGLVAAFKAEMGSSRKSCHLLATWSLLKVYLGGQKDGISVVLFVISNTI